MKPLKSPFRDTAITVFFALGLALFCRRFVIETYRVPNASMNPTLLSGDRIFVLKWAFELSSGPIPDSEIERGDVVVFTYQPPSQSAEIDFVRRVIGIPGDHVEIQRGIALVNGRSLAPVQPFSSWCPEERLVSPGQTVRRYSICLGSVNLDTQGSEVVPEGHLFVVGDSRVEDSSDPKDNPRKVTRKETQGSNFRFLKGWGMVPISSVKGRALWRWTTSQPPDSGSETKSSLFLNHHLRLERVFRRIQ